MQRIILTYSDATYIIGGHENVPPRKKIKRLKIFLFSHIFLIWLDLWMNRTFRATSYWYQIAVAGNWFIKAVTLSHIKTQCIE